MITDGVSVANGKNVKAENVSVTCTQFPTVQ